MSIFSSLFSRKKTLRDQREAQAETQRKGSAKSVFEFLSKNYGWIIVITGAVIVLEQTWEHSVAGVKSYQEILTYYGEVVIIFILLGLISLLIRKLLIALAEKSHAINILNMKHTFIQQISTRQGIPEVTKSLVQQIASIVPSVEIELFIHEQNKDWFIRVNHPDANEVEHKGEELPSTLDPYPCRNCMLKNNTNLNPLKTCQRDDRSLNIKERTGFCLPLVYGTSPVGLLLLYSPEDKKLLPEQKELLENLSVEMSNAIGMVIEMKAREDARMTEKIHTMQLDIARDLHDTVGQNIGYLRMKLDYLSENNEGVQSDLIMEIRSMSKVANESYDLVRGTLAVLQADDSVDLLYMFSRYAEQITERSGFGIEFTKQGTSRSLSAGRVRHLFYVFREALSNIEKHASATEVHVNMNWDDNNLTLEISDNGQGYDLARTQKVDIHYGLKFMKERARILNGSFLVNSTVGHGTKVSISIPCE